MFYIFSLFSLCVNNRSLYNSFGFNNEFPIIIGFILFSDALAPMDLVVKFLMNVISRKFEFQAGKLRPVHPQKNWLISARRIRNQTRLFY